MIIAILLQSIPVIHAFSINRPLMDGKSTSVSVCLKMSATNFNYGQQFTARKNIRLPLLVDDVSDGDDVKSLYDVPLPNSHLPPELTTASLYELKLDIPIHKSVIQEAISSSQQISSPLEESCCYGHVVYTPQKGDDLVGSIGCASEILIGAPTNNVEENLVEGSESGPLMVLARGSYRFIVKEVVKSIPYPIAICDEVLDDNIQEENETKKDEDIYDTLEPNKLVKEIFTSLERILQAQLAETSIPLSPLQASILGEDGVIEAEQKQFDAEERLAVFQTFISSLLDIAADEKDRHYAIAMIAGELVNLSSDIRRKMLITTNGVERLRMVLRELVSIQSMDSAKLITKSLSLGGDADETGINIDAQSLKNKEDDQKNLQVGTATLPPWANQIQKGNRVEYWWDENEGWCLGTVDEDPVKIMDEILLSVKFDDDGSIHKIPFKADEKARWRPPQGDTGSDGAFG